MNTRPEFPAQAPDQFVVAVEVGKGGVTRYDWSVAFSRMCLRSLPLKNRDVAMAAAMRVVEYPGKGAGQCTAKRITIANELGISERHLNRGLGILEAHGWIKRQRGGPDDPVIITLMIPAEGADIHRFGAKGATGLQDNMMSRKEAVDTGQKSTSYRTQIEVLQDTQDVPYNEQVYQKEQSAPKAARAPEIADRESVNGTSAPASGASPHHSEVDEIMQNGGYNEGMRIPISAAVSRGMTATQIFKLTELEDDPAATLNSYLSHRHAPNYRNGADVTLGSSC
jgi:hypothetical protein